MRSNKGITLTSLIVYMIVFCIVIGTVASISGYFNKNTDEVVNKADSSDQYIRITTYLTDDINSINYKSIEVKTNVIDIEFLDGTHHIYLCNDNKIYYNVKKGELIEKTITICDKIEECSFSYIDNTLKITIKINGITYINNYSI